MRNNQKNRVHDFNDNNRKKIFLKLLNSIPPSATASKQGTTNVCFDTNRT